MSLNLPPAEQERLARVRFALLSGLRASGVVLMLFGMWIWFGDLVHVGGYQALGLPLFLFGMAESIILPRLLVRR